MTARALPVALAVAVLATGCSTSYEGGSKKGFLADGNAVCEASGYTVWPALKELEHEGLPTDGDLRGFVGDVAVPALQTRVDRLRQLDPPTGDRKTVDDMIVSLQKGINIVRSNPRQIEDGDPFLESNADLRAYGLTSCVLGDEK
jgi:hypothetical protein